MLLTKNPNPVVFPACAGSGKYAEERWPAASDQRFDQPEFRAGFVDAFSGAIWAAHPQYDENRPENIGPLLEKLIQKRIDERWLYTSPNIMVVEL